MTWRKKSPKSASQGNTPRSRQKERGNHHGGLTVAVDEADANTVADTAGPGRAALGQLLVRGGHISPVQLDQALEEGSKTGERLGEVVVKRGWVTEDDVAHLLAEQWGLSYVDRASIWFDANALARLSREDAQRLEALPTRIEDGRVVVAVAEPTEHRLEALRKLLGDETVVIVVPKSALEAGLRSELLPSRGGKGEAGDDHEDGDVESSADGEASSEENAPPQLHAVAPLPDQDADGDSSVDSVMALAAQARGIADMLAEQAASIRNEAARADTAAAEKLSSYETQIEELEGQVVALEARVEGLEAELASRQEAMDETAGPARGHASGSSASQSPSRRPSSWGTTAQARLKLRRSTTPSSATACTRASTQPPSNWPPACLCSSSRARSGERLAW